MNLYSYDGPVTVFGKCVVERWTGQTYAVSESKARVNLAYQYNKSVKRLPTANVHLPGNIILIE